MWCNDAAMSGEWCADGLVHVVVRWHGECGCKCRNVVRDRRGMWLLVTALCERYAEQ